MKWKALVIPVVVGLTLCACASAPTPVPVSGNAQLLTGKWHGEFRSNDGGYSGTINFQFQEQADTAYGDVLLIPSQWSRVRSPQKGEQRDHAAPELLAIRFVHISDNVIRGTLADHRDPVCGCTLRTVFDGAVRGDTITGSYRTYHVGTPDTRDGTWQAYRSRTYAHARVDGDHVIGKAQ